jgi:hypothetical protein
LDQGIRAFLRQEVADRAGAHALSVPSQLCVNSEPFIIGVQAELGASGVGGSNPPRPPAPGDDDDVDDLDSEDRSTDREWWNRHRKNDKSKTAAPPAGTVDGGGSDTSHRSMVLGSRSAPPLGSILDQYSSNMPSLTTLMGANQQWGR